MDVISVSFQIVNGIDPFPFFSSVVQVVTNIFFKYRASLANKP